MLRVLSLTSSYPHTERLGPGLFVERQLTALAAREGCEVEVVAPVGIPPFPWSMRPRFRVDRCLPGEEVLHGLRVHRPRFTLLPDPPFGRPEAIAGTLRPVVAAIRERFAFDLIQAEFYWPDGPVARELARHFGVPFTVKSRGPEFETALRRPSTARVARQIGAEASALLAVSAATRQVMVDAGLSADRIAVHRTGLDAARFHPRDRTAAKAALKVEGPLLLSVGNLTRRKRQSLALDALRLVEGATLILVGSGPEWHALKSRTRGLGLEPRVRMTGSVPNALLPTFYAAADVTVHASEREGLANIWIESLACGTPVVTTDAGAAREVFERPEAGRIVAADPVAIAAAVRELLAAPPDPARIAATVTEYSWERNAAELEIILRRAIGAPGPD